MTSHNTSTVVLQSVNRYRTTARQRKRTVRTKTYKNSGNKLIQQQK